MHAVTIRDIGRPQRPAAAIPLVRDPYDHSALYEANGALVSANGERSYRLVEEPHRIYDLFADTRSGQQLARSDAPWNPDRFDDHYRDVGYYADGAAYEAQQGAAPALTRFHHQRVKDVLLGWIMPDRGHAVMDVGCGAGWFLERVWMRYHAAGFRPHVVGLEASRMQASFAARRMSDASLEDGMAVLGNAERLPFADESFDLVTCTETLEQVEHPARAIEEMARVLKPGGRLMLSVPSRLGELMWDTLLSPATKLAKAIRRRGPAQPFAEYYAALYPEEIESQVTAAGLQIHAFVQNGLIPHNHYFHQLPERAVSPLVQVFDWLDRRYAHVIPQLTAHTLVWAEKPLRV